MPKQNGDINTESVAEQRFCTILADPPWPGQSGERHYATMSLDRIGGYTSFCLGYAKCSPVALDNKCPLS